MDYQVVRSYVVYRNPSQIQAACVGLDQLFHAEQSPFSGVSEMNYANPQDHQAHTGLPLSSAAATAPD